jgi:uncharacterized repeat protein (TIGR03803 family)
LRSGDCAQEQTFTTLATFDGTNGANPYLMSLIQGLDGNLYGTTYSGGTYNVGTVFQVSTASATSGFVTVTTSGNTLTSNKPFRMIQ